jgi:hypothetical protein
MNLPKREESQKQIQIELPDYSQAYYEYMQKKKEQESKKEETVVIIDIY